MNDVIMFVKYDKLNQNRTYNFENNIKSDSDFYLDEAKQ